MTLKKRFVFLSLFSLLFLSAACSQNQSAKRSSGDGITIPECGLVLPLSSSLQEEGLVVDVYGSERTRYPMVVLSFSYLPAIDALYAEYGAMDSALVTEAVVAEFRKKMEAHSQPIATILAVPTKEYKAYKKNGFPQDVELLSQMSPLGKKYGNTYLFLAFENDTGAMTEEEKVLFHTIKEAVLTAAPHARFMRILEKQVSFGDFSEQNVFPDSVPPFSTADIYGNPVTEHIFSLAELTVLNIWGTFCGPCIQEMPLLADWSNRLGKNVQIVGIVCDVFSLQDETIDSAKTILEKAGVTFTNLVASDSLAEFIAGVQFVPTTVLVDASGTIVSEPIVGADVARYERAVEDYFAKK